MRILRTSIGILLGLLVSAGTVHAATSTSFILQSDFQNKETGTVGSSPSFAVTDGGVTWYRVPSESASYRIVPATSAEEEAASSASSASGESGTGGGGGTLPGGNRRPRVEIPGTHGAASSSSSSATSVSSSSLSSSSASSEEAASSSSSTEVVASSAPAGWIPDVTGAITLRLSFFDAVDRLCQASAIPALLWFAATALLLLTGFGLVLAGRPRSRRKAAMLAARRQTLAGYALLLIGVVTLMLGGIFGIAQAAQTAPDTHVYNGRLLDSSGNAITTAHSIRFSYWTSADHASTDTTGAGAINTAAATYASWNEVHTVTPNSSGYFSVELGSVTALPSYQSMSVTTLLGLFLQVEVKSSAAADTAYELLDTDPDDATIDRSGVLSVPFAGNADSVDRREIGTGSGSIPILGSGGVLPASMIPGGTNSGTFVLDADNTESSTINLQFGATLAKKLTYNITTGTFTFNDDLRVEGNLTVTGLVNGVDVTQLQSSTGALKAFSGGGLNLNVSLGGYRLNGTVTNYAGGTVAMNASATNYVYFGSGGLAAKTAGFPGDESYIPVALVTTSAGSILTVTDRRVLSSDDRERTVVLAFNPEFEKAAYQADGSNNVGQLSVLHDTGSLRNHYGWSSTKSSLQDYDILLRIPLSEDFVRWKSDASTNPITLTYRSTSASSANNKLDIQLYDTAGNLASISGSSINLANTSWTTTQLELTGSTVWSAGGNILLRMKMSAKDGYRIDIGGLTVKYVELMQE